MNHRKGGSEFIDRLDEIRERHRVRTDDGWITINGTHVQTDKDGNLKGAVGQKIGSTSKKGKASSTKEKKSGKASAKTVKIGDKGPHGGKASIIYKSGTVEYEGAKYENEELSKNEFQTANNVIVGEFARREGGKLGIGRDDIDFDRETGMLTAWCKPSSLKLGKEMKKELKNMGVSSVKVYYQAKPYAKKYQVRPNGRIVPLSKDYDYEYKGMKY